MIVNDLGWRFLLTHGFDVKSSASFGGIAYYSIERSNAKHQAMRRNDGGFEYRLMGHLHTEAKLTGTSNITYMNGALPGDDGYAHNGIGVHGLPSQLLLAVTEKRGVIGSHTLYAEDLPQSPFVYNELLVKEGAYKAMEAWKRKVN